MKQQDSQKNEKQNILISMDGEQSQKILELKKQEVTNIRTLKKKILNKFDYEQSESKKIQLNIKQIYPSQPCHISTPVFNESNLKIIIDFLINYQRPIKIHATFASEEYKDNIKRKQQISQQALDLGQIYFDQNGSIIDENDQMKKIIPTNQKYDNSILHVRCQFCHRNNQDVCYLKKCGGLYGPFKEGKYVHILCAIWCHEIYIQSTTGLLRNVEEEIKRAEKLKCKQCQKVGAGLTCDGFYQTKKRKQMKCRSQYHFKCLSETNCTMNWATFKFLCSSCKKDQELLQCLIKQNKQKKENQHEKLECQQNQLSNMSSIKNFKLQRSNSQSSSIEIKRMFMR